MTESGANPDNAKDEPSLDLNSLLNEGIMGPDWAVGDKGGSTPSEFNYSESKRERRERKPRNHDGGRRPRSGGGQAQGRRQGRTRENQTQPYRPVYNVQLQPQGQAFAALIKAIRDSCRTYELFEIATLFLSKSDRFVAKVWPIDAKDSDNEAFHISVPDGIGFESEDEAVAHVLANHLGRFFDVEEVETEPPKGTFNVVNRCSVTGDLLGPPNYHRYKHILQEHFASKIKGMSFDRFTSRIQTLSEQESIDAWIDSMKKRQNYKDKFGDQIFSHLEDARRHLLMNNKSKVVKGADICRVDGKDLNKLPNNSIRRSIEAVLASQLKFPLEFANHLRSRLRRANFTIYKRGGRGGITYACSIQRQYRAPGVTFSDSIQELIQFIENNPDVTLHQILHDSTATVSVTKTENEEKANPLSDASELEKDSTPSEATSCESVHTFVGEKPSSSTLAQDLRWLVQSGFVTEYSDGRLFAPPIRE
ncbi:MAG: hypothetical protein HN996_07695, partial [Opitutae bacterium]|nr:hypothetical protein [Opitutae bacterium]